MRRDRVIRESANGAPSGGAEGGPASLAISSIFLYLIIVIGRVTELMPPLTGLPIGDLCVAFAFGALILSPKGAFAPIRGSFLLGNIVFFAVLCAISISYSIWFRNSVSFFMSSFALTLILYFLVLKTASNVDRISKYLTALTLCSATLVVASFLARSGLGRLRVASSYDENDLAMIIVSILPIVLLKFSVAKGRLGKSLYLGLAVASAFVVVLTQSRGGMIGLAAVILYLIFFDGFKENFSTPRFARVSLKLGLVTVLSAVLLAFAPESALERLGSLLNLGSDYNVTGNLDGRLSIWGRGFAYLRTAPWGTGISAFNVAESMMGGQFRNAHNSFVQAIVEIGVVGGIAYVMIYVRAAVRLRSISNTLLPEGVEPDEDEFATVIFSRALLGSLIGYSVCGFFLSHAYSPLGFIIFALAAAIVRARNVHPNEVVSTDVVDKIS